VESIGACENLHAMDRFTNFVKSAIPLPLQDFVVNLREHLCAVWRELGGAAPRTHAHELAIYHAWIGFASQALHGARPICFLDTCSWS